MTGGVCLLSRDHHKGLNGCEQLNCDLRSSTVTVIPSTYLWLCKPCHLCTAAHMQPHISQPPFCAAILTGTWARTASVERFQGHGLLWSSSPTCECYQYALFTCMAHMWAAHEFVGGAIRQRCSTVVSLALLHCCSQSQEYALDVLASPPVLCVGIHASMAITAQAGNH